MCFLFSFLSTYQVLFFFVVLSPSSLFLSFSSHCFISMPSYSSFFFLLILSSVLCSSSSSLSPSHPIGLPSSFYTTSFLPLFLLLLCSASFSFISFSSFIFLLFPSYLFFFPSLFLFSLLLPVILSLYASFSSSSVPFPSFSSSSFYFFLFLSFPFVLPSPLLLFPFLLLLLPSLSSSFSILLLFIHFSYMSPSPLPLLLSFISSSFSLLYLLFLLWLFPPFLLLSMVVSFSYRFFFPSAVFSIPLLPSLSFSLSISFLFLSDSVVFCSTGSSCGWEFTFFLSMSFSFAAVFIRNFFFCSFSWPLLLAPVTFRCSSLFFLRYAAGAHPLSSSLPCSGVLPLSSSWPVTSSLGPSAFLICFCSAC